MSTLQSISSPRATRTSSDLSVPVLLWHVLSKGSATRVDLANPTDESEAWIRSLAEPDTLKNALQTIGAEALAAYCVVLADGSALAWRCVRQEQGVQVLVGVASPGRAPQASELFFDGAGHVRPASLCHRLFEALRAYPARRA